MAVDKSKSLIMAQRLKDLRTERGLSHESLRKALMEKYEIDISVDSLKNYEVSKVPHAKAYKNEGMRVEYLRCLADFYGVSSDYLIGLSDAKTSDPRATSAMEYTGLSEEITVLLHTISMLGENDNDANASVPEIVETFKNRSSEAINPSLLRFEMYRLIEAIISQIAESPLLYGPAFQNYIYGTISHVLHRQSSRDYALDDNLISELREHGYQVIQSRDYAELQLNAVFDTLKEQVRASIFHQAKKCYGAK